MKNTFKKITTILALVLMMVIMVPANTIAAASSRNINYAYNGTYITYIRVKTEKATTLKFSSIQGKVEVTDNSGRFHPVLDSHQPYIVQVLQHNKSKC